MGKVDERKQSFLEGAFVLTTATMVAKVLGALFKIPLANILGGVGMSYFSCAYDLFTPIYSVTVTGMGVAASRLVAEYAQRGKMAYVEGVFITCKKIFIWVGIGGMIVMFLIAPHFVKFIDNSAAYLSVIAIVPAILFSCISAVYRGYYQGLSNMVPTAVSQVVESMARMFFGILFSYGINIWLLQIYYRDGEIFGNTFTTEAQAQLFILRFGAAGAILGVSLSAMVGTIYIRRKFYSSYKTKSCNLCRSDFIFLRKKIVRVAVPVAISTLVINLSTLIDLTSVMNCLKSAMVTDSSTILEMYSGKIPEGVSEDILPEYLYGSYTGLASSLFNLVPAVTAAFGISALPVVSRKWVSGDRQQLEEIVNSILYVTMIVAVPAGLGIFTLAEPILTMLYPARLMEVGIVAPILKIMGIGTIFVAATTPMNSILQAVGKEKYPVYILLFGAVIKLITNFIMVSNPEINIQGVPYGTLICYIVTLVLGSCVLILSTGITIDFFGIFIKPFIFGGVTCTAIYKIYHILPFGNSVKVLVCVAVAVLIYIVILLLFSNNLLSNIKFLPNSEKMLKRLEKFKVIG